MKLLFCSDPSNPRQPDDSYQAEAVAAERLGCSLALLDHDALVNESDPVKALRRVPQESAPGLCVYRGWMLTPDQYRLVYESLEAKGLRFINDLAAYRHCHNLPESYSIIKPHTPRSVWLRTKGDVSLDEIMALLLPFGSAPLIVKDFVKSRKLEWAEACFIPCASDRASVERVVRRFLELQGDDLAEGLVFREFIEFEPLSKHPKSGMPLTKEFRLFFLDGQPIFWVPYWDDGNYEGPQPPLDQFAAVGRSFKYRWTPPGFTEQGLHVSEWVSKPSKASEPSSSRSW